MSPDTSIRRVVIENGASDYALSSRILKRLGGLPAEGPCDPSDMDKETMRLVSFKGEFLKPCPGTKEYICCGYQILHVGTNCPMECSYCILQAYFNEPSLRIFVNLEDQLNQIGRVIDRYPEKMFRIGTGEFMDSLSLDHIVGWSDMLLPFFSVRKNSILELKTKTDRIEGLLSSDYRDQIIVSWSLNSPLISSKEEHGAPSLKKRFQAARKCQSEGYTIGFHFDPLVHHPNWKDGYLRTIEMMDSYVDPTGIIWISLGCLRYIPHLKAIIRRRHPGTHILDGEFIRGLDGKMRYFKPIRIDIYAFMAELLGKWSRDLGLYLCMESGEVWQKSLGWSPRNSDGLSHYLDERARESFAVS